MDKNLTIVMTGSMLMGAGLGQLATNSTLGLELIGVGVLLQVLVAVLNKYGIPVQANIEG